MIKPYRYKLTPSAVQDLDDIAAYIAIQLYAEDSNVQLLNEIESAILSVCDFPQTAPPVNDALLKGKGYRKLIVKNYIILYIPDDEACILNVMRVVYYAKDYLKEL
ncbi:MAG: type II toxin-antitoxin system RelE/ParE family toxin [Eubacteriales bacterium]|nr:type II toxin-antitoxin system RelE/ParE family toxin [Eubacteriales bacterium]